MSWDFFAFSRAVRDSDLPSTHRLVLMMLALRTDPTGECYPSYELLAGDTGLARRTVTRAIPELLNTSFLTRIESRKRSNGYRLTVSPDHRSSVTVTPDLPIELPSIDLAQVSPGSERAEPKVKLKGDARGTRLPQDWKLLRRDALWAMQEVGLTEAEVRAEAEVFKDHWLAQPGMKGRKSDWKATWRNWVRRRPEFNRNARKPEPAQAELAYDQQPKRTMADDAREAFERKPDPEHDDPGYVEHLYKTDPIRAAERYSGTKFARKAS
jgi:hypothetical protein